MTPWIPGEKVCIQRSKGVKDEMFHMYIVVLEDLGVRIPFTPFEMDVLKYLNSWRLSRGFEVLCDALDLEPSIWVFFHFYGTKCVDKIAWVSISSHPSKKLFLPYASNFKRDWRETFVRVQWQRDVLKLL